MSVITDPIVNGLVWIINACNSVFGNYWISIIVFTLITKIILLPLSIWVQKNSIKQVVMMPEINRIKATYMGNSEIISEEQVKIFKKYNYSPLIDLIPLLVQLALLMGVVEAVKKGTELTQVPVQTGGATLIVPIVAALSAFVMCYVQNRANVLQSEQGKLNKYGTMAFSVALSLYLGFFVSIGVGLYWIASNLFSTLQLLLLNVWINPKKYVDYEELEKSKAELEEAKKYMTASTKKKGKDPYAAKEKEDYKRFNKLGHKKVVFYSERNGFYKYYKNIIEEIIKKTNITVHYITSDPQDEVFDMESEQFKPYYISDNRMIVLMMKMETDIMVMTTPDLDNYQLKRSYVKKDTEYIYVPHDVNSSNLTFHKNALDHFDTIFTSGPKNEEELREREEKFSIKAKNLVPFGSCVIDNMTASYEEMNVESGAEKTILIAPSWQKDNIMDSCVEQLIDLLGNTGNRIIVRPHPQYVRHYGARIEALKSKYESNPMVEIQSDFSSNKTVYTADVLLTDWSSIAFEYTFSTLKPVLFINTPMKVVNPDYKELNSVPIDIELRDKVGISVDLDRLSEVPTAVDRLLNDVNFTKDALGALKKEYIFNNGSSGEAGAAYIIKRLVEYQNKRKNNG